MTPDIIAVLMTYPFRLMRARTAPVTMVAAFEASMKWYNQDATSPSSMGRTSKPAMDLKKKGMQFDGSSQKLENEQLLGSNPTMMS